MNEIVRRLIGAMFFVFCLTANVGIAFAGPPYETDDPDPVAYRHYEMYIGAQDDREPGDDESALPFAEVNFGPLPNVQIAVSLPFSLANIAGEPPQFGIGNLDTGIKYRFVTETATRPMVSFYPSIELPTGKQRDPDVDNTPELFLPIWAQKTTRQSVMP